VSGPTNYTSLVASQLRYALQRHEEESVAGASGSDEGRKPAGSSVPFKPDYTAAREMASRASTYARRGREVYVSLDYSDASIEAADEVGLQLWESMPLGLSEAEAEEVRGRLIFELGAYFGETFIQNHGGHWGWATMAGRKVFALRTESGFVAFPMNRARKRLRREEPDTLATLYRFLSSARPTLPGRRPRT
jgi:hypothetical protein